MPRHTSEQRIAELTKRIERRKQFIIRLGIPLEFWEKQREELIRQATPQPAPVA